MMNEDSVWTDTGLPGVQELDQRRALRRVYRVGIIEDHERRVAENENAPLELEELGDPSAENPDLDFILRELRNLDHQHWSSSLAESIQSALESVHTGPSRGVKQGPFAVITNALMPAVLVELGFLTNRQDERLLSREDFQEGAARSMAGAILEFFERYPPGRGSPSPGGDR